MFLSVSRDRAHRGLDGDRQAGGDRRRSRQARSAAEDGGRAAFLPREEWAWLGSPRRLRRGAAIPGEES
jgi:hypothetical protein